MVRGRTITAVVLAAGALALGACGSSGSDGAATTTTAAGATTTSADGTTSSTTVAPATSTTVAGSTTTEAGQTTTTESSEGRDTDTDDLDTLSDGDHVGHVAGVERGVVEGQAVQVILFDEVEVLTGQAAIDAATADGVALDTDHYVNDDSSTLVSIAVAPDASVTTLDGGSSDQVPSSVREIADAGEDALHTINTSTVRGTTLVNSISGYYLA